MAMVGARPGWNTGAMWLSRIQRALGNGTRGQRRVFQGASAAQKQAQRRSDLAVPTYISLSGVGSWLSAGVKESPMALNDAIMAMYITIHMTCPRINKVAQRCQNRLSKRCN